MPDAYYYVVVAIRPIPPVTVNTNGTNDPVRAHLDVLTAA